MTLTTALTGLALILAGLSPGATEWRLEARRWWNAGRLREPARVTSLPTSRATPTGPGAVTLSRDRKYAILFFGKQHEKLLRSVTGPLNRLDASGEWRVIAVTGDEPNDIARLVYRHRILFAVGAGGRNERAFGIVSLPALVLVQPGSAPRPVQGDVAAAADDLLRSVAASSGTAEACPVEDRAQLSMETPLPVLYASAITGRTSGIRIDAARLLKKRLSPDAFARVLEEMLAVEPPEPWNEDHPTRSVWYQVQAMRFAGDESIAEDCACRTLYVDDPKSWDMWALVSGYQVGVRDKTASELAQEYVAALDKGELGLAVRKAILRRLSELPADEVLPHLPALLAAERDVCYRCSLVSQTADAWRRAEHDWSDVVLPLFERCTEPDEHLAVQVTAREMLRMIAEGRR